LDVVGVAYFFVCSQFIADQARNPFYTLMSLNTKIKNAFFAYFSILEKKVHISQFS